MPLSILSVEFVHRIDNSWLYSQPNKVVKTCVVLVIKITYFTNVSYQIIILFLMILFSLYYLIGKFVHQFDRFDELDFRTNFKAL